MYIQNTFNDNEQIAHFIIKVVLVAFHRTSTLSAQICCYREAKCANYMVLQSELNMRKKAHRRQLTENQAIRRDPANQAINHDYLLVMYSKCDFTLKSKNTAGVNIFSFHDRFLLFSIQSNRQ